MRTSPTYTLEEVDYHRNGISGEGFHVVKFHDSVNGPMLGVVFPYNRRADNCRVAVFNRDKLRSDVVAFGVNSWRGDHYASWLRLAILLSGLQWRAHTLKKGMESPHAAYRIGRLMGHLGRKLGAK